MAAAAMVSDSSFQDNAALLYHLLQKDPLHVDLPAHGVLITDETYCDTIRAHLLQQVAVQRIDLSGSRLSSLGLRCLVDTLEGGCAQQLTSLRLRDTRLATVDVPEFLRLLNVHALKLTELDLGGNLLGDEVARDIAQFVRPGLTSLSLADNQLSDSSLQLILKALNDKKVSSLTFLNISGNRLGLRSATALGAYLTSRGGGQTGLLQLCVRHAGLDDAIAQPLAEGVHVSSLEFLDIAENNCAATFCSTGADSPVSLPASMRTLDISHNRVVSALIPGLCENLRACASTLEDFYLAGCCTGDAALERLAGQLPPLPRLRRLSMMDASLSYRSGAVLGTLLSHLPSLERFDLSGSLLDVDGAAVLSGALEKVKNLRALSLASCRLCNRGAVLVVSALVQSRSPLEELDLSFNHIDDTGTHDLCTLFSLPESPKLRLLLLSGNACTVHARADLEDMLNAQQTECTVVARDTDLEAVGQATEDRNGSQCSSMQASVTLDIRGV